MSRLFFSSSKKSGADPVAIVFSLALYPFSLISSFFSLSRHLSISLTLSFSLLKKGRGGYTFFFLIESNQIRNLGPGWGGGRRFCGWLAGLDKGREGKGNLGVFDCLLRLALVFYFAAWFLGVWEDGCWSAGFFASIPFARLFSIYVGMEGGVRLG